MRARSFAETSSHIERWQSVDECESFLRSQLARGAGPWSAEQVATIIDAFREATTLRDTDHLSVAALEVTHGERGHEPPPVDYPSHRLKVASILRQLTRHS